MALDFFKVDSKRVKSGMLLYPKFIAKKSKDLMIKGKSFYAIWDEEAGLWSKDFFRAIEIIDRMYMIR